jgi:hypothetical protein
VVHVGQTVRSEYYRSAQMPYCKVWLFVREQLGRDAHLIETSVAGEGQESVE